METFSTLIRTGQDWSYSSQAEKRACKSQPDNKCYLPRGKMVGGTTGLNGMQYVRGAQKSYDQWRDVHNCSGWGFEDVLPYFKKSEKNTHNWNDPEYHSQCGKVCISFFVDAPDMEFFSNAGNEAGIPNLADINGAEDGPGFVKAQGFQCNGRRTSASKAYLIPVKKQSNYRLIQKATVTKIQFNGTKAIGVEFYRNGIRYVAKARKEVIISAGAIGTPTLLLLSGIGPKDMLAKNNVSLVLDSPNVGQNLVDHMSNFMWYSLRKFQNTTPIAQMGEYIVDYYKCPRTGQFAGLMQAPSLAFLSVESNGDPIIEVYHSMIEKNSLGLSEYMRMLGYKDSFSKAILAANKNGGIAVIGPTLLQPYSKGSVELHGLTGVEAFLHPYINFSFYSDPNNRDREIMIKAMQQQIALEKTETYKKAGATMIVMPHCFEHEYGSYEFCDCYIEYFTTSTYHPVGTCRMGTDPKVSVVNTKGQVHGIEGLRIVDASM